MMEPLRIATRGSELALWQARFVADQLRPWLEPRAVDLVVLETTGDVQQVSSLTQIGGQGVFTKEIQRAVLDGRADLAVHSLKDLPTTATPGLELAAVPPRAPTGDAFISHKYKRFADLPHGARLASGSPRRRAQLWQQRPDLRIDDLRGNVDTRLRKLVENDYDGTVLAEAGLVRLGLADRITEILDPAWMVPAVGQGALGIECRTDDTITLTVVAKVNDPTTRAEVLAERAFLRGLGAGCLLPVAARGTVSGERLTLRGAVYTTDGRTVHAATRIGLRTDPESLGYAMAEELIAQGAKVGP